MCCSRGQHGERRVISILGKKPREKGAQVAGIKKYDTQGRKKRFGTKETGGNNPENTA